MSKVFVLEQASVAAQQANWRLLNQYLQQLVGRETSTATVQESDFVETPGLDRLLSWALEILESGDFQERWDVAKVFPKLGKEAVAPLIAILEDEEADLELRWFAGRILGEFEDPAAIAALVELLTTAESEELSSMAAASLANFGTAAIDALTGLLANEHTRLLAVQSLAHIRSTGTIEPLLSVVNDHQPTVRSAAIEALCAFHEPRIPPILIAGLNDLSAAVRKEAVIGLGLRPYLLEKCDLVELLRSRLRDFNLEVCCCSAIALGRVGTDAAAAALFEVLQAPTTPEPLQLAIVRALGWVATAASIGYLREMLLVQTRTPSFQPLATVTICQEIVAVLGRLQEPDLIPAAAETLIEALQSHHSVMYLPSLKCAIALSLGQLGYRKALDALLQLLADSDAAVRLHAIAAMKQLAPQEAYTQLQHLATAANLAPNLKAGIAIALQEWMLQ